MGFGSLHSMKVSPARSCLLSPWKAFSILSYHLQHPPPAVGLPSGTHTAPHSPSLQPSDCPLALKKGYAPPSSWVSRNPKISDPQLTGDLACLWSLLPFKKVFLLQLVFSHPETHVNTITLGIFMWPTYRCYPHPCKITLRESGRGLAVTQMPTIQVYSPSTDSYQLCFQKMYYYYQY